MSASCSRRTRSQRGGDCPRAETLMSLRPAKDRTHITLSCSAGSFGHPLLGASSQTNASTL